MKDWKQKCLKAGIALTICGLLIMFIGFGMAGFNRNKIYTTNEDHWYQTIHVGDGEFRLGIGR